MLGSTGPGPFRWGVPVSHQAESSEEMETHSRVEGKHQNASPAHVGASGLTAARAGGAQEPSPCESVGKRKEIQPPQAPRYPQPQAPFFTFM